MIHLFKNIFLEDDEFISPRYELLPLASTKKENPLGQIFNESLGQVDDFETYIKDQYNNDLENFWYAMINKNHPRPFVLYADTDLFLKLIVSYWKSIWSSPSENFLFEIYNLYRIDAELKMLSPNDQNIKAVKHFKTAYPKLNFSQFQKIYSQSSASKNIAQISKLFLPIEIIIPDYFATEDSKAEIAVKKTVLQAAWKNWCRDIDALKTEVLAGFYQIHQVADTKGVEWNTDFSVLAFIQSSPELQWLIDTEIKPENADYIISTYPENFFPRIQSAIDKICHVQIKIKGLLANDVDTFNQASQTKELFAADYKALLQRDIQRNFGSFFLKDDLFDKVNHFLLNRVYSFIQSNNRLALEQFKLN